MEVNGKAAQLDGTYALEKKENGTDGQVCHYRLEDTTIKNNTADIKMKYGYLIQQKWILQIQMIRMTIFLNFHQIGKNWRRIP